MLALPGGVASTWHAEDDAVLWLATDEPALAFLGVRPGPASARRSRRRTIAPATSPASCARSTSGR